MCDYFSEKGIELLGGFTKWVESNFREVPWRIFKSVANKKNAQIVAPMSW